ncbi:PDZ domain-containing protein [Kineosphaera limosa]|uniref:endopeptidase La n=1 Tax=Kineosphaera limosa NBRC 100340 TaxID=1184609 RepID=K6WD04_9MICO|nr:PDZ domain-containing protein [Kineosphaera limosa]NYE02539.1 PDZ domain-containing protein [Kineosphaera limosa]GAB97160.1 hypothetical protein KILIM_058_00120 [Kineosphaera limosa NBRC 100340]
MSPRVSWQLSPRTRNRLIALLVVLAIAVAGLLYRPPYVILRAGPVFDTLGTTDGHDLVRVTGIPTYPTTGTLDLTTVAQYGGPGFEITTWDLLAAFLDPGAEIRRRDELYPPDTTRQQVQERTAAQMAGSQHNAAAVALRAIGKPEQAVVAQVLADGPAAGRLHADDIVLAVNGTAVTRASQVSSLIQEGGSTATLRVRRSGQEIDVAVPTRIDQGRRMVGIGLEAKFDDSIDVAIDAGNVGGPSAGMMFALAVYDKVTPGPLTGGQKIAGTGTVGIDGAVGPIGGITHKLVGAADAGATWFLAPAADCAEVVGNIPDGLQVAKVATFDEARQAVEQIGAGQGDRVPTCTP